jgi:hypothetical protein
MPQSERFQTEKDFKRSQVDIARKSKVPISDQNIQVVGWLTVPVGPLAIRSLIIPTRLSITYAR